MMAKGLAGHIAEARAWKARENADAQAVRVFISIRWPCLEASNRDWLFTKIMETEDERTPQS